LILGWKTEEGLFGVFLHYLHNVVVIITILKENGIGVVPSLTGGVLASNMHPQCQHMAPCYGALGRGGSIHPRRRPHIEEKIWESTSCYHRLTTLEVEEWLDRIKAKAREETEREEE
jgi:hypothetical protein